MADDLKRVDVGFSGGQVLALRMRGDEHDALRRALEGERQGRWHVIKTEDSEVAVDLGEVVYVRVETEKHSVGF
jgi:hypothetical protein